MQTQGIALWRWISWHRRELAVGTILAIATGLLVLVGPGLLLVAALEWKRGSRRLLGLVLVMALWRTLVWLWRELRCVPHGDWHPCVRCGAPIEAGSRAWYCSPLCRRYARLERDAGAWDPWVAERAEAWLRALARSAELDPNLSEIPF
jgi:hypothetical protein